MDDDAPPGVPEWVVTYGDMMSLLLTFFIMLVSLSEVAADKKYRAVLEALQAYQGYRQGPVSPPGEHFPLNGTMESLRLLGSFTDEDDGFGGGQTKAVDGRDVRVFRTREGEAVRVGELLLFARFSAELDDITVAELERIAEELAGKPNKIEIRAHCSTDPLPESSVWKNHTALSYARARQISLALQEAGVDRERIRLTAAGDTMPLPRTGDRIDQRDDRAEVLISNLHTAEVSDLSELRP